MIYTNVWSSVTVFTQALIAEFKLEYPDVPIEYFDWDAHATKNELPNADLIGPLAISTTQLGLDMHAINFSIGVSTYASDKNLFRQRHYIARIFEEMSAEKRLAYMDSETASRTSTMAMTDGTMVAPMAKAELRPWQFVQGDALLVPVVAS